MEKVLRLKELLPIHRRNFKIMKKYLSILFFIFCSMFFVAPTYAVTPTITPEDKTTEIRDQLITNIASRVAQLKLVEKRGVIGKVNEVTNTQITITDLQDNTRFIDVDELTKFSSPTGAESFGISDITKNSTIGILGLYNKESRRILARFVNVITMPIIIHGGVSTKNNDDYSLNIATEEGKQMTADVENLTRTKSFTQSGGFLKSGFSKIKENNNIIAIGTLNKNSENKLTATKIIFFPEIPASPKVNSTLDHVQKSK
jgi:hypothetical protein